MTAVDTPNIHDLVTSSYVDAVLNEPIRFENLRNFILDQADNSSLTQQSNLWLLMTPGDFAKPV